MNNDLSVRISVASPEADLSAVVWPGVSTIYYPRTESADQIQAADAHIGRLEMLRGIRPGTITLVPVIESPLGITMAHEIASSSPRIQVVGVGPHLEALYYARSECELVARALGLNVLDIQYIFD
jgi:citrate lyase beta subunit